MCVDTVPPAATVFVQCGSGNRGVGVTPFRVDLAHLDSDCYLLLVHDEAWAAVLQVEELQRSDRIDARTFIVARPETLSLSGESIDGEPRVVVRLTAR